MAELRRALFADVERLIGWLETLRDLVQRGGPVSDIPLARKSVAASIGRHDADTPERQSRALVSDRYDLIGSFQNSCDYRAVMASVGRASAAPVS